MSTSTPINYSNDNRFFELCFIAQCDQTNYFILAETLKNFNMLDRRSLHLAIGKPYSDEPDETFSLLHCLASNLITDIDDYMNTKAPDHYTAPTWYDELDALAHPAA